MTPRLATTTDGCSEGISCESELADAAAAITVFTAAIADFIFFLGGGVEADAAVDAGAGAAGARVGGPSATGALFGFSATSRDRRNNNAHSSSRRRSLMIHAAVGTSAASSTPSAVAALPRCTTYTK